MKKLIALIIVLTSTLSMAAPICNAIGTRSEGWYQDGELIEYDSCKGMEAKCMAIGTRGEGWYAVDKETGESLWPIQYDNCGKKAIKEATRSWESDLVFDCLITAIKVCRMVYDALEQKEVEQCELKEEKVCTPTPDTSADTDEVQLGN